MIENITEEQRELLNALVDPDEPEPVKYTDDKPIQQEMLCLMIRNKYFMDQSFGLIKPEYFVDKAHQVICRIVIEFFENNKRKILPTKHFIINELKIRLKDNPAINYYIAELQAVIESYDPEISPRDSLLTKISEFAKQQGIRSAINKVIDLVQNPGGDEKWIKIEDILKAALLIGPNTDLGLEYFSTVEERYERMMRADAETERFSSGFKSIDEGLVGGGLSRGEIGAFMALPGCGKTFRINTKVLMFDGSTKFVQDVVVGDLVMGPDSKPRTVLNTHNLMDFSYEIKPIKGDSYFVNRKHILSLKNSHKQGNLRKDRPTKRRKNPSFEHHFSRMNNTDVFNISVEDWFKQSNHFKIKMKGWRTGVTWEEKPVKIDPYALGIWLGDGHSRRTILTNIDNEVVGAWKQLAEDRKLEFKTKDNLHFVIKSNELNKNSLRDDLKYYNLIKNKHLPIDYKNNSREVRLQVLAGLIDTDGSKTKNGFDFVQKNKTIAEDVVFLARSLGLAAYIKPCKKKCQTGVIGDYWRVSISGDCSIVPVRIPRKQCTERKQIKNALVTGIKVIPTNKIEPFYGFEVDGDKLFLLGDFTVVHNSVSLVKSTVTNLNRGKKVLYISLEMDQDKIAERLDTMLTGVGINELKERYKEVIHALNTKRAFMMKETVGDKRLYVKQFPAGSADVISVRAFMSQLGLVGFKPDLVIIDYVGEFRDMPGMKKHESLQRIVRDLRGLAVEEQVCILTAMQPNRTAREAQKGDGFIDDSEIGDSFGQARPMDAIWSINMNKVEQESKVGRIFVVKHRHGKSRYSFHFKQDPNTLDMIEIDSKVWLDAMSSHSEKAIAKTADGLGMDATKFKPNS